MYVYIFISLSVNIAKDDPILKNFKISKFLQMQHKIFVKYGIIPKILQFCC